MRGPAVLLVLTAAVGGASAQGFEDRTFVAGLGRILSGNGVAVADYDRDGDLDVYVVNRAAYAPGQTATWNGLYANRGDGTFTDQTLRAGVAGSAGVGLPSTGGNGAKLGAAWGDYDGDGWPDLYLTHAGPNQLYRNLGDGTFADVTAEAGVAGGPTQLSTSALWFDGDGDGDLDLHVGVWEDYAPDGAPRDRRNPYFENLGDGTFREVSTAVGLGDPGQTYTTLPVDVDRDGDPDLYDANDFGANRLFLNAGDGTFTEATAAFGLEDRGEGMGLALGDVDGDGLGDLFLTNRSDSPTQAHALFLARPEGGFAERAAEAGVDSTGWGWGAAFFDLENDGDDDLFVANGYVQADTPNTLFENAAGFPLMDVAEAWGVDAPEAARGLAVFDADGDGRLDLIVGNVSRAPRLYANRADAGAWLAVALVGDAPNVDALGAVVEVEAGGRRWVRAHHGAQFLGQNLTPVHVGLGPATAVDRVTVRWPDGTADSVADLAVNQPIRVRQGEGLVEGRGVGIGEAAPGPRVGVAAVAPNPTGRATTFRLDAAVPVTVDVRIVDVLGRPVRVLRHVAEAGSSGVTWDGRDAAGAAVAPGVYLYTVTGAGGRVYGAGRVLRLAAGR